MSRELPADAHQKLRAARVYAGIDQKEMAEKVLGLSRGYLNAIEAGRKPMLASELLDKYLEECGVPYAFLEHEGFAVFDQPTAFADLDARVEHLAAELSLLRRDVRAAQGVAATPPEGGRRRRGPGAAAQKARQEEGRPTPGAQRGSA